MANVVGFAYANISSTAQALGAFTSTGNPGIPLTAKGLRLRVTGAAVRLRYDDGTPSTAVASGETIPSGGTVELDSWSVPRQNFKAVMPNMNFCSTGDGSTGVVTVHFFD